MAYDNSANFDFCGNVVQVWEKPDKVQNIILEIFSAGGGGSNTSSGGNGSFIFSNFINLPSTVFNVYINIGQGGMAPSVNINDASGGISPGYVLDGSFNKSYGGNGSTSLEGLKSGGGGGVTSLFAYDPSNNNSNVIKIIAGGGGGGGINGAGGNGNRIGSTGAGTGGGQGGNTNNIGDGGEGGISGGVNGYTFVSQVDISTNFFKGAGGGGGGSYAGGGGGGGYGGGAGGKEGGGGGGGSFSNANVNSFNTNGGAGGLPMMNGTNGYLKIYWNTPITKITPIVQMFMLDAQYSGKSPYYGSFLEPIPETVSKKTPTGFNSFSNQLVITTDRELYIISDIGTIYKYNHNFEEIWTFTAPPDYKFTGTPAIISGSSIGVGGSIYVLTEDLLTYQGNDTYNKTLFALIDNGLSASKKWQLNIDFTTTDSIETTLTVDKNNSIYFGTLLGRVYAITDQADTYAEEWIYQDPNTNPSIRGTIALNIPTGDDFFIYKYLCYVNSSNSKLNCIDISGNGIPIAVWERDLISSSRGYCAIDTNNVVYVNTNNGLVYAYNVTVAGTQKWGTPYINIGDVELSAFAVGNNNYIYVISDSKFNVINTSSGTVKWQPIISTANVNYKNSSPMLDFNNNLYFGTKDGKLYSVNGVNRTINWIYSYPYTNGTARIQCTPVISSNNHIYYGDSLGNVFDISVSGSPDPTAQPIVSMFMLNTLHTGLSEYTTNITTPVKYFTYSSGYQTNNLFVLPAMAIDSSGAIYLGTNDGFLHSINSNSGLNIWKRYLIPNLNREQNIYTTPAIGLDGSIYVGSCEGILYALRKNGTIKWSSNLGGRIQSSPIIDEYGTIYIGAGYFMYAITDGTAQAFPKWLTPYETSGNIVSSPALNPFTGIMYFGSDDDDGHFYAIDSFDGTAVWTTTTGKPIYSSPTIDIDGGGKIIIGNGTINEGTLFYLDNSDGSVVWQKTDSELTGVNSPFYNTVAINGDVIYLTTILGIHAIDRTTGVPNWNYKNTYYYYTSPTIDTSGTLFVGAMYGGADLTKSNTGHLLSLQDNGLSYTENWIYQLTSTTGRLAPPVISSNGKIYISATDNKIYSITNNI